MEDSKPISARGIVALVAFLVNAVVLRNGFNLHDNWYWGLFITIPFLATAIVKLNQSKNAPICFSPVGHRFNFVKYNKDRNTSGKYSVLNPEGKQETSPHVSAIKLNHD